MGTASMWLCYHEWINSQRLLNGVRVSLLETEPCLGQSRVVSRLILSANIQNEADSFPLWSKAKSVSPFTTNLRRRRRERTRRNTFYSQSSFAVQPTLSIPFWILFPSNNNAQWVDQIFLRVSREVERICRSRTGRCVPSFLWAGSISRATIFSYVLRDSERERERQQERVYSQRPRNLGIAHTAGSIAGLAFSSIISLS